MARLEFSPKFRPRGKRAHQIEFANAQTAALACRYDLGMESDRRQDRTTAAKVAEALHMKTAFGLDAAIKFLWRQRVDLNIAERVLAGRYDPRQSPDQAGSSGTVSPY